MCIKRRNGGEEEVFLLAANPYRPVDDGEEDREESEMIFHLMLAERGTICTHTKGDAEVADTVWAFTE